MRLPVNHALPLVLIAAISGGAGGGVSAWAKDRQVASAPVTGPAADYPVVVGPAFQVGNTTYTPEDRLNYDAVGYADVGQVGGATISGAHKTLPLPSYVEVTSLESGKTILLRVERRGPMTDQLIELSPGAAAQLGLAGAVHPSVRVRRVNPPEQERAMLRAGGRAPDRMETPRGLLDALNRKLNAGVAVLSPRPVALPGTVAKPMATPSPAPAAKPTSTPAPKPAPRPAPTPTTAAAPAPRPAAQGSLVIQVAAFSAQDRANSIASKLGGRVSTAGRFWRVRLGPFATRAEAEAALAKAKGAGYSDARIQRAD
jgi:rare lipoprotein A